MSKCGVFLQRNTNQARTDAEEVATFVNSSEALYRSPGWAPLDDAYSDFQDDFSMLGWITSSIEACSKHNYNKPFQHSLHKPTVSLTSCIWTFLTLDLDVPVPRRQVIERVLEVYDVHIAEEWIVVTLKNVKHRESLHVRLRCKSIGTIVRRTRSTNGNVQFKKNRWNSPIL